MEPPEGRTTNGVKMSFDHDKSMARGADLQRIRDQKIAEFHGWVNELDSTGQRYYRFALVAASLLFNRLGAPMPALEDAPECILKSKIDKSLAALAQAVPEEVERNKVILEWGKLLLESGLNSILSAHAHWESETFQE
jgi:hypothetical protein